MERRSHHGTVPVHRRQSRQVGSCGRLVGNPALEGFTAPKLLWMRDEEPSLFDRTRTLLLPKDFVRLVMTGEKATEPSDAAGTLLFDVRRGSWSDEMIAALQLDPGMLPPVRGSAGVTGALTADAAEALGLRQGIPVVGGGADNAAAAVGSGVVERGSDAGFHRHLRDDAGSRLNDLVSIPVCACIYSTMRLQTGGTRWELSCRRGRRWHGSGRRCRDPERKRTPSYDELIAEAVGVPPGADGLTFLPYLTGERTPHADSNARGRLCGYARGTSARTPGPRSTGGSGLRAARLS